MFASVKKCFNVLVIVGLFCSATTTFAANKVEVRTLGQKASPDQIQGWDIDIRPDGLGLPEGSGDATAGEDVFIEKCAACHGEFGEGAGRYPVLTGGEGTLDSHDPVKTVGSYWPYATTLFDYINRAMPFGHAQSLSSDEVYGMTAYILYMNEIIDDDLALNADTLARVEMPNRYGFIEDDRPDVPTGEPCMNNCLSKPATVVGHARQVDVTPEKELETATSAKIAEADGFEKGKTIYAQCAACHSLADGEHRFGPSLYGLIDRKAGAEVQFLNYSASLAGADFIWSEDKLKAFLSSPQTFLPGTSMPFFGFDNSDTVDSLLIYLKETTKK